jgi:polar amino acid transport system substrate-binding protein
MKRIILISLCFPLLFLLISCNRSLKVSEIKVAVAADFFPFAYTENDSLEGLEIELLSLLESRLRVPFNITTYYFVNLLEAFYNGDYDIAIGGVTITEGRREIFDFSVPYFNATQTILSRPNTSIVVDSLDGIGRYRLGVLNHSTSQLFIENTLMRERRMPAGNLRRYNTMEALLAALTANEVNIIALENTIAELFANKHDLNIVYTHYIDEFYGILYKQNSSVAPHIERALNRILSSEEWKEIKQKHLL